VILKTSILPVLLNRCENLFIQSTPLPSKFSKLDIFLTVISLMQSWGIHPPMFGEVYMAYVELLRRD